MYRFRVGLLIVCLLGAAAAGMRVRAASHDVVVSQKACGDGWPGPVAGRQTISLRDASRDPVQVYLIDPASNLVYAEARDIRPGNRRDLATTLGAGHYALRCVFSDGTVRTSKSFPLSGASTGVAGVAPMPDLDLAGPVSAYRAYVRVALPGLLTAVRALGADVRAGRLDRARADWLPAHLDYERLGAAYTSFEDFDGAIDGTTEGLPGGVHDPSWTGFFRIEYGLWHGQTAPALRPLTDGLIADVRGLIADFPSQDIDPGDLPLRTHEILENALEFQVGGSGDYGSGTTLATTYANTQGTLGVLDTLRPLLAARQPSLLAAIDRGIATVQADLLRAHTPHGWTPVTALPGPARQQLDADLDALLEALAVVPNLLYERTSA